MPIIIPANSAVAGGFDVANSCRFNSASSDNLVKTPSSTGNRDKWTWSAWVKLGKLAVDQNLFTAYDASTFYTEIQIGDTGRLNFINKISGSEQGKIETERVFRDLSAWYHFVIVWDSGNATAGNRMRIYVNGVEETSFATDTNPSQDQDSVVNFASRPIYVGSWGQSQKHFDGYMAEVVLLDGTAASPTSFGEFDEDSGIWKPIDVSGLTPGTNGAYLDFEDASNLGNDVFGGTDFTENNLTAIDQSTDTCTNNFATLNILNMNNSGYVFSEGNLKGTVSGAWLGGTSTFFVNRGKWYWEYKYGSGNFGMGIAQQETDATYIGQISTSNQGYISYNVGGFEFFQNGSDTFNRTNNGNIGSYGSQATSGQIVMIAYDADNGKLFAGRQGTFFNSSNPATGASPMFTVTSSAYFTPSLSIESGVQEINFGSPPYSESGGETDASGFGNFAHEPPSGFFSLCTKNLAEYG